MPGDLHRNSGGAPMCSNPILSHMGRHAYGFAIAGIIIECVLLIFAIMPPFGTLITLGTLLCLIGDSYVTCCCCPFNRENAAAAFKKAAVLNVVGMIIRFYVILQTGQLMLWTMQDFGSMGRCGSVATCWSHDCTTSESGIWPSEYCFCYPDNTICSAKYQKCVDGLALDPTHGSWNNQCDNYNDGKTAATCTNQYDASDLTYNWCTDDTKDWGLCKDGGDNYFAYHNLEDCKQSLKSNQDSMVAVAGIVSFFVKPFFLFCIAGTICNFGVAIFGMLPVVNLDDGDEGTVANKKEARTVV